MKESMRLTAQDEKSYADTRRRKPNRVRQGKKSSTRDEITVSKRAARYARPYIFGEDE